MGKNYIPANDAAFDKFFKRIVKYVEVKCTASRAEWLHITKGEQKAFYEAYIAWHTAYVRTFHPHAPQIAKEKMRQRVIAEKALREFVNSFLRGKAVSTADRSAMGIPSREGKGKQNLALLTAH